MNAKSISYHSLLALFVIAGAMLGFNDAAVADDELVTRVYPVADLIFVPPNYPFEGISTDVPARPGQSAGGLPVSGGGFGGGGGGFGGGGGGLGGFGGGGFGGPPNEEGENKTEKVPEGGVESTEPSIRQLTRVIQDSVATSSWAQIGGPGSITVYGNRLIIFQTPKIHAEIKAFLTELRASGMVQSTVTVRANWLRLDAGQYQKLLGEMPVSSPPLVNRKVLEAYAAENTADAGEVTCFDGQTVHIISGRFRNAVIGVTPVVGQNEFGPRPREVQLAAADDTGDKLANSEVQIHRDYTDKSGIQLAQVAGESGPALGGLGGGGGIGGAAAGGINVVGYQPQSIKLHAGALLELTPTRMHDDNAVVLDLKSKVTQWNESLPGLQFNNVVKLDQTSVVSQQLSTTLKAPIGKPVLVGGLSLQPGAAADDAKGQLFLVVEVVVAGNTK
jgi:hypothetical protein